MPQITSSNLIASTAQIGDGVIVDADVNASAAIAWTKLSKTGSNLTDIATRAITDLSGTATVPLGGTGLATITTGSILKGAGTGNMVEIAPGTANNVLTSNGTIWTSAAPAGVPAWTDLGALTWMASTDDQSFTGLAAFEVYMLICKFRGCTDVWLQFNGSTTSYYWLNSNGATWTLSGASAAYKAAATLLAGSGVQGTLLIQGETSINGNKQHSIAGFLGSGQSAQGSGNFALHGSWEGAATQINAIKVLVNAGTTTGKVHLYGLNL